MKEGIFFDISNEDYHKIRAISSTNFSLLEKSVKAYQNKDNFLTQAEDSQALIMGSLMHTALLEPDKLEDEYLETTTKTFDTKETKKLISENPNKIIVPLGAIETAKNRAFNTNLIFGDYLENAKKEVSFIVYDDEFNIYRKCRVDIWLPDNGIVIDFKTSKELNEMDFIRNSLTKFNYHLQASFYIDTINMLIDRGIIDYPKINNFAWIVSPNLEPYIPFGGVASDDLVHQGRIKYRELLSLYNNVVNNREDDLLFKIWNIRY